MGGSFTAKEKQILMPLVADTVNYGLSEKEALAYIHTCQTWKADISRDILPQEETGRFRAVRQSMDVLLFQSRLCSQASANN